MHFENIEPTTDPVIQLAINGDNNATELVIYNASPEYADLSFVSSDEDGLYVGSPDGRIIRDHVFEKETVEDIMSKDQVTILAYDSSLNIVFRNLEVEIVQPSATLRLGA